jgi:signal transduction histidine kinase
VPPDRYGIRGMRERAELVGATLKVESRDRDGTRITIEVTNGEGNHT